MENAVEALKIAGAVLMFILALMLDTLLVLLILYQLFL